MTDTQRDTQTDSPSRPAIRFATLALDTPDPAGLARFYAELLGWRMGGQPDDD